jgi:hypothetical protein
MARGYPLVGDEMCCIDLADDRPLVYPAPPRLKLWRDSLEHLGWPEDGLVRDHFRMDKFHLTASPNEIVETGRRWPLQTLYLLAWGDLGVTRLTGLNALRRLIEAATYRPDLVESSEKVGPYWEQCARLARLTPVWELSRPREWAASAAVVDRLIAIF